MTILSVTRTGHLDATAWVRCHLLGDLEGKMAIARHCNPNDLVEALTAQLLGLLQLRPVGDPLAFLAHL